MLVREVSERKFTALFTKAESSESAYTLFRNQQLSPERVAPAEQTEVKWLKPQQQL